MKQIIIEDLHFEHKNWKSQLDFQKDEIKSFTNRLAEVIKRWTDQSVLKEVEHFQNFFLVQNNALNKLKDKIDIHEHSLGSSSGKISSSNEEKHHKMRDDIETHFKIYNETKRKYLIFLTTAL